MARAMVEWSKRPDLPPTHYVHPAIYTDPEIFRDEQEKIFGKVWYLACHESELPEPNDYRTYQHPAGKNLLVVRGQDGKIRTFYNVCPHRGNTLVYAPAGNARHITCLFHAWAFDTKGDCIEITRQKQGYGDRLAKKDTALREVKTEVGFGGFVYVNLDDGAGPLAEFIGHALDGMLKCLEAEPLEIFSYHRAVVNTNFKFWHDTNSEFYHDYMHYHNRQTSMLQPSYWEREYVPFPNGHAQVGDQIVKYEAYEGFSGRELSFPGLPRNGWKMVDFFPGFTYNLRGSALRIDTILPLGPARTVIEYRGLGLKSDGSAERAQRARDYNTIWGPFGRNLHEDLMGVMGQGRAIGKGQTYILHGREEGNKIHDEIGMRHYYAEWSRRMGRRSSDPYRELAS
ncbi:MAG: methanesulfonate monooxygenase [Candidatus Rokuibacteriota bacterium]|nr:MAG: methanesulfonate monooxygenase [Candidatus Rokubacteria bacterium]